MDHPFPTSEPSNWSRSHLTTHFIAVVGIAVFAVLLWQRQWFVGTSHENGAVTYGYVLFARIALIILSFILAFYAFVVLTLVFDWMKPKKYTSFYGQVLKTARTTRNVIDYVKIVVFLPCLLLLGLPSLMTDYVSIDAEGLTYNRDNSWINPHVTEIPFSSIEKIDVREGPAETGRSIVFYLKGGGGKPVQAPPLLARMDNVENLLKDASKRNRIAMTVER